MLNQVVLVGKIVAYNNKDIKNYTMLIETGEERLVTVNVHEKTAHRMDEFIESIVKDESTVGLKGFVSMTKDNNNNQVFVTEVTLLQLENNENTTDDNELVC